MHISRNIIRQRKKYLSPTSFVEQTTCRIQSWQKLSGSIALYSGLPAESKRSTDGVLTRYEGVGIDPLIEVSHH